MKRVTFLRTCGVVLGISFAVRAAAINQHDEMLENIHDTSNGRHAIDSAYEHGRVSTNEVNELSEAHVNQAKPFQTIPKLPDNDEDSRFTDKPGEHVKLADELVVPDVDTSDKAKMDMELRHILQHLQANNADDQYLSAVDLANRNELSKDKYTSIIANTGIKSDTKDNLQNQLTQFGSEIITEDKGFISNDATQRSKPNSEQDTFLESDSEVARGSDAFAMASVAKDNSTTCHWHQYMSYDECGHQLTCPNSCQTGKDCTFPYCDSQGQCTCREAFCRSDRMCSFFRIACDNGEFTCLNGQCLCRPLAMKP